MNVGSILNEDPPSNSRGRDFEKNDSPKDVESHNNHQRHSIVNLLNDTIPSSDVTKTELQDEKMEIDDSFNSNKNDEDVGLSFLSTKSLEIESSAPDKAKQPEYKESIASESVRTHNISEGDSQPKDGSRKSKEELNDEDEFKKLSKLHSTDKPRRYLAPPIWAQEWHPSGDSHSAEYSHMNGTLTALSSKHVFDPSSTIGTDLECSITGVIPPPSVTRTIAEWVYANFNEISDENRQYVELELKFGTIIDKRHSHRINIDVSTECIYTNTSSIYFDMGVHEVGWNEMCQFLDDLEKNYQEELRKAGPNAASKPKRKFNVLESDITDSFYQVINRNEQPKSIRISKDNLLNPPRYTAINKQRISDLYIHNPSSMYDLRLSLSLELPIPEDTIDSVLKKNKPTLSRIKKRNSWTHRPTVSRFDMTRVLTPKELKNKLGKSIVEQDQSFEVELEIDTLELFNGYDKFKGGSDTIRFEELIEIFVNNARCLNNRVTRLANK
ncbi:uncharacterized protein PRCAT00003580001 [Priceomyces carsonii]|uniref:uncharacterized protein n=1 Tax=Priceomyces carsonii TaxID=28549 RepID=UPI002ED8E405|nr:unnamed protein product [Priceomyces carsonii]